MTNDQQEALRRDCKRDCRTPEGLGRQQRRNPRCGAAGLSLGLHLPRRQSGIRQEQVPPGLWIAAMSIPAGMLVTLARQKARTAVLEQFRASGLRPWWDREAKDISKAANVYLKDHPELFAQAAETVRNCPKLSAMAEREVKDRRRRS